METDQQTLNVQDLAGKLATELKFLAQVASSAGCLTGEQIADCASDVLRIDFRCTDVSATIRSLPATVGPFLRHAFDNPKDKTNVTEPIARLERVSESNA